VSSKISPPNKGERTYSLQSRGDSRRGKTIARTNNE
jgi:hypothetical protein